MTDALLAAYSSHSITQFWVKGLNADVRTAAEALTGNEINLSAQQV
jgi:hypothetical protein